MKDQDWLSHVCFQKPLSMVQSAWVTHAPFAFWLVDTHKPKTIVELGTHYGFSYFCFCQQVVASKLSTRCAAIDTWRGDEHAGFYDDTLFYDVKNYNDRFYGSFSRLIKATFDESLSSFDEKSIDILHIDGHHFYHDVKHDFESWVGKLSDDAVVLFHDTQVKKSNCGVWKLWNELSDQFPSFEFLHGFGLGILCYGTSQRVTSLPIFDLASRTRDQMKIRQAYNILGEMVRYSGTLKRNDPCPCGSGERFKRCHGKIGSELSRHVSEHSNHGSFK